MRLIAFIMILSFLLGTLRCMAGDRIGMCACHLVAGILLVPLFLDVVKK